MPVFTFVPLYPHFPGPLRLYFRKLGVETQKNTQWLACSMKPQGEGRDGRRSHRNQIQWKVKRAVSRRDGNPGKDCSRKLMTGSQIKLFKMSWNYKTVQSTDAKLLNSSCVSGATDIALRKYVPRAVLSGSGPGLWQPHQALISHRPQ